MTFSNFKRTVNLVEIKKRKIHIDIIRYIKYKLIIQTKVMLFFSLNAKPYYILNPISLKFHTFRSCSFLLNIYVLLHTFELKAK